MGLSSDVVVIATSIKVSRMEMLFRVDFRKLDSELVRKRLRYLSRLDFVFYLKSVLGMFKL